MQMFTSLLCTIGGAITAAEATSIGQPRVSKIDAGAFVGVELTEEEAELFLNHENTTLTREEKQQILDLNHQCGGWALQQGLYALKKYYAGDAMDKLYNFIARPEDVGDFFIPELIER